MLAAWLHVQSPLVLFQGLSLISCSLLPAAGELLYNQMSSLRKADIPPPAFVFPGKLDNDSFNELTRRGDLHRLHQQQGCVRYSARHAANTSIPNAAGEGCPANWRCSCGARRCWPSDPNLRALTESRELSS